MQKLSVVDPSFLTNKQKLAFWINVYNFCVMHVRTVYAFPRSVFSFSSESGKLKKQRRLSLSCFLLLHIWFISGVSPARLASIPGQASRTAQPGLF
jgi:hypothetical protein